MNTETNGLVHASHVEDDDRGHDAPFTVDQVATSDPWSSQTICAPSDWYTTPPPKRSWLLRDARHDGAGVLPLGKAAQAIAEGGAGKTMIVMQLAIAIATGTRWLGVMDVARPGRVFLALGEEDAEEAHRRLYQARRAVDAPIPPKDSIVVLPLAGVPCAMLERDERSNLTEGPFLPWLRKRLAAESDWSLVVVDPLARFAGPDAETDNAAATRFVQALESLVPASGGATILNAHHTNKVSRGKGAVDGTAGRGSTGLFDGARWQCALGVEALDHDDPDVRARLGEVVTLGFTKSNYSRKADAILLRRDQDNGGALLPLDSQDLELVAEARSADPARARTATRQAQAARDETERCTREDAALDGILTKTDAPTSKRGLRAALAAALGTCSHDRADAAIERRRQRCA